VKSIKVTLMSKKRFTFSGENKSGYDTAELTDGDAKKSSVFQKK